MNILLLTDSDAFAGTERHMLELAQGLRGLGVSGLRIACPDPSPIASRARDLGIPVLQVEKKGLIDFEAIGIIRKELSSGRASVIHAHNGRTALVAAVATKLSGRGRCIATQHFLSPDHTRRKGVAGKLFRAAHHWVDHNVHHFIAVSQAIREKMTERGEGSGGKKITVVPNGMTVEPDGTRTSAEVRAELGIAPDAPMVVCAARLEVEKDVQTLVAAMRLVCARLPNAVCVIAGEGTQRAAIESTITEWGLSGSVRLLGFRNDVLALVQAADIFVLPSRAEPFGLVLLEAMALCKPVIAAAAGGPAEIVSSGETGILVPPGDTEGFANAILSLLGGSPDRRTAMGQAGRKRFDTLFTAGKMAAATLKVYSQP